MGGLSIINGKLINDLIATYSDRSLHLRPLAGGGVQVWLAERYDTQYSLTNAHWTFCLPLNSVNTSHNGFHTITECFLEGSRMVAP